MVLIHCQILKKYNSPNIFKGFSIIENYNTALTIIKVKKSGKNGETG